jgi:hypothetical protein
MTVMATTTEFTYSLLLSDCRINGTQNVKEISLYKKELPEHTYLPTYLPTYPPTYLPTYLPACLPTYVLMAVHILSSDLGNNELFCPSA